MLNFKAFWFYLKIKIKIQPQFAKNAKSSQNTVPLYSVYLCYTKAMPQTTPLPLFSYRKFWAHRFGPAPFLPMSRQEMTTLGWDSCDIIIVTGDAYVDHHSFGMAIIGRLLEAQGFRVGVISQPDWHSCHDWQKLGKPNLFFGVTSGNLDSMVNHYTADRKIRSNDAYTPNGAAGKRPNHAVVVYAQRCREAYPEVPIVIGGIEASLRRIAHYDYWSDQIKRSILLDSKADLLIYGNAERAIVELSHRLAKREPIKTIHDLRGTAVIKKNPRNSSTQQTEHHNIVTLPSYQQVRDDKVAFTDATKIFYHESNPYNANILVQADGDRLLWINPPAIPLTTAELDQIYDLPFARVPHPSYQNANIPAYEMIRFSINIMRGCFGGCTFCSLTAHEGRIVQNRSVDSIEREMKIIRDSTPSFTGVITDLGGPTANMYRLKCKDLKCQTSCRKLSCIYPKVCPNMNTNHAELIKLYRQMRSIPGIKKICIGSGMRYDLAIKDPEYIKELVTHHVGGYLKIAPEHICAGPLAKMMKPGIETYQHFHQLFNQYSKQAKKEQYLIPYFISAHPGTSDQDMLELALWLKANNYRLDQVQNFIPTPLTIATTMYYTGLNPLQKTDNKYEKVFVPKSGRTRRLHKALLRYHDPNNWPLLRQELRRMGRNDLIGNSKRNLIPYR